MKKTVNVVVCFALLAGSLAQAQNQNFYQTLPIQSGAQQLSPIQQMQPNQGAAVEGQELPDYNTPEGAFVAPGVQPGVVNGMPGMPFGGPTWGTAPGFELQWGSGPVADLLARCYNWVTSLQQVRWQAGMIANGNPDEAANILYRGLQTKLSEIQGPYNPAPHTSIAIRVGYEIVKSIYGSSQGLRAPTRGQLRYLMADSVYGLIENAFVQYDQVYYQPIFAACNQYGCRGGMIANGAEGYLPPDYYQRVARLAVDVLDFQQRLGRLQAYDSVQLQASLYAVNGAKNILNASILRRTLACSVAKLDFAENQIQAFIRNPGMLPAHEAVRYTEQIINDARQTLESEQCVTNVPTAPQPYYPPHHRR
jgi:hypothetical protein